MSSVLKLCPACAAVAVVAGLLMAAAPALGQTQPSTQDRDAPRTGSPFWGDDARSSRDYERDYDDEEEADAFPTDLVARVAPARGNYVGLQAELEAAQDALNQRLAELQEDYEESSELREVRVGLAEARATLDRIRNDVLSELEQVPEYAAAASLQERLGRQIEAEHARFEPDEQAILAMSQQALDYGQQRSAFEQEALADAPDYEQTLTRLRELGERLDQLQRDYQRRVNEDGEVQILRQRVRELRTEVAASGAYFDSAAYAADVAVAFARDKIAYENLDRYGYGYGYNRYGYPYGGHYGWHHRSPFVFPGVGFFGVGRFVTPFNTNPVLTTVNRGGGISTVVDGRQQPGLPSRENEPLPEFDQPPFLGDDPNLGRVRDR